MAKRKTSPKRQASSDQAIECTNPDQPDGLEEFSIMKREISDRVKALGVNAVFAVTGDRNYILEDDGTLRMRYATVDRATNQWRREEWELFVADTQAGLWDRLEKKYGRR